MTISASMNQSSIPSLDPPSPSTRTHPSPPPPPTNFHGAMDGQAGEGWEKGDRGGIIAEQWPTLSRAMSRYEQGVADRFSHMAYDAIESGIIRHEERDKLSAAAADLAIRPFDAQLLIACALRQWALDRDYDPTPTTKAPILSFEYRSWKRVWTRIGLVVATAAALDWIILCRWLS